MSSASVDSNKLIKVRKRLYDTVLVLSHLFTEVTAYQKDFGTFQTSPLTPKTKGVSSLGAFNGRNPMLGCIIAAVMAGVSNTLTEAELERLEKGLFERAALDFAKSSKAWLKKCKTLDGILLDAKQSTTHTASAIALRGARNSKHAGISVREHMRKSQKHILKTTDIIRSKAYGVSALSEKMLFDLCYAVGRGVAKAGDVLPILKKIGNSNIFRKTLGIAAFSSVVMDRIMEGIFKTTSGLTSFAVGAALNGTLDALGIEEPSLPEVTTNFLATLEADYEQSLEAARKTATKQRTKVSGIQGVGGRLAKPGRMKKVLHDTASQHADANLMEKLDQAQSKLTAVARTTTTTVFDGIRTLTASCLRPAVNAIFGKKKKKTALPKSIRNVIQARQARRPTFPPTQKARENKGVRGA